MSLPLYHRNSGKQAGAPRKLPKLTSTKFGFLIGASALGYVIFQMSFVGLVDRRLVADTAERHEVHVRVAANADEIDKMVHNLKGFDASAIVEDLGAEANVPDTITRRAVDPDAIAASVAAEIINEAPRRPDDHIEDATRFKKFKRGENIDDLRADAPAPVAGAAVLAATKESSRGEFEKKASIAIAEMQQGVSESEKRSDFTVAKSQPSSVSVEGEPMKVNAPTTVGVDKNPDADHLPPVELAVKANMKNNVETPLQLRINRGVNPDHAKAYNNGANRFQCLDGSMSISWDSVNDDYCDCGDGSDEPGTAACPDAYFYCLPQQLMLRSFEVNDGHCDCCDGSDELDGPRSCPNICDELEKRKNENLERHRKGTELRRKYSLEGSEARAAAMAETEADAKRPGKKPVPTLPKMDWGPENAFFPLTKKFYNKKASGYEYSVRFFDRVYQDQINLGSEWSWIVYGTSGVFSGGKACPGGARRETRVTFLCSESDNIASVVEIERCIYSMKFETPAACQNVTSIE